MNRSTNFIGIDISKKVFDVWCDHSGHKQFRNNKYANIKTKLEEMDSLSRTCIWEVASELT